MLRDETGRLTGPARAEAGDRRRHRWTDAEDETIRTMRGAGAAWSAIAAAVGVSIPTAIDRAAVLGVRDLPSAYANRAAQHRAAEADPADPAREPLPAGHARTWGAIAGDVPYDPPSGTN
jgi:hypothetical protein